MLRIAICCGGGFSSSTLAAHLEKQSKERNLGELATFTFIPINSLPKRQDEVDIAMVCPHSEWKVRQDAGLYHIPVTVIPPRLYGLMPAQDFIEDAIDLKALWDAGKKNPMTFDDEPRPLAVRRMTSHRRWLNGETADFNDITK